MNDLITEKQIFDLTTEGVVSAEDSAIETPEFDSSTAEVIKLFQNALNTPELKAGVEAVLRRKSSLVNRIQQEQDPLSIVAQQLAENPPHPDKDELQKGRQELNAMVSAETEGSNEDPFMAMAKKIAETSPQVDDPALSEGRQHLRGMLLSPVEGMPPNADGTPVTYLQLLRDQFHATSQATEGASKLN